MFAMVPTHTAPQSLRSRSFSLNPVPSASKSPRQIHTPPRRSQTTQLLPTFSTPGKQQSRRNPRNSFPLYVLLHTFRYTRGRGYPDASSALAAPPTLLSIGCITPFNATLTSRPIITHSKALTPKLNPLDATFTKNPGDPSHVLPQASPCFVTSSLHSFLPSNSLHYSRERTP